MTKDFVTIFCHYFETEIRIYSLMQKISMPWGPTFPADHLCTELTGIILVGIFPSPQTWGLRCTIDMTVVICKAIGAAIRFL